MIVLTQPQAGASAALREEFSARDWYPIEQEDPYLALAEICLRQRAQAARAAWGLQPLERLALVVIDPERWPQLRDLAAAVQRYVPGASVWTAQQDELTLVAPAAQAREESKAASTPTATAASPRPRPMPRALDGDRDGEDEAMNAEARNRISREEIDMLLELRNGEDQP